MAHWHDPTETECDRHYDIYLHFLNVASAQVQESYNSHALGKEGNHTSRPGYRPLRGVIILLVLIATKCRDSTLRWTAAFMLRTLNFQEGVFRSHTMGLYAQRVVAIEEQRAREMTGAFYKDILTCEDVPEEARFFDVTLEGDDYDYNVGTLVCALLAHDADDGIRIEENELVFSEVQDLSCAGSLSRPPVPCQY